MPHPLDRFSVSRRRFICASGAASLAISPMAKAATAMWAPDVLRLGVVLPQSTRYPQLASQLLAGFQAYAASPANLHGRPMAVVPIGCGCGARAPIEAASDAVKRGAVDMLTGLVDPNLGRRMAPLLEERGVVFVASDIGADVVRHRWESPFLVRNSMGYWQASYAMGQWAPAHLGRRTLIVSDFLESGYDMVYAFRRAFEGRGGEVLGVSVTGLPDGSGTFAEVGRAIRARRPDFVYAFFSGHRAERFLRFYTSERLARVAPLAGPGLLTDSVTTPDLPPGSEGIVTAASWETDMPSPGGEALRSAYRSLHGEEPSLFAMLGYETALRIARGLVPLQGDLTDPVRAARSIASAVVAGPRGKVVAHDAMGDTSPPVYVRRVSGRQGRLVNETTDLLPAMDVSASACHEMRSMIKTGWAQPYLAA